MVSTETLLSYLYRKISFTVHTDASENSWVLLLVIIINLLHSPQEDLSSHNIITLRTKRNLLRGLNDLINSAEFYLATK